MSETYKIEELSEKLRPIFETAPVYKAILFGSYARGISTSNSDIDIVIDSRGELRGLNFYSVLEDMVEALNIDVDLFEASEIRQNSTIHNEIIERGVILYER